MALTREQILGADDLTREEVPVPEWGGTVFLRAMTGTERMRYEKLFDATAGMKALALLLAMTLCDEAGRALFSEADVEAVMGKNGALIMRLFEVARRLNRLSKQDIEELEKNSPASPSAASPSG